MPISKIKTSSILADAASTNLNIDAGTLFLDTTNNFVGVGTTSPTTKIQITRNALSGFVSRTSAALTLEDTAGTELYFASSNTGYGQLRFGDNDNNFRGAITYDHSDDSMYFFTGASTKLRIDSVGNVGIGATPSAQSLVVGKNITGSAVSYGILNNGTIQSDVTTTGVGFSTSLSTQATAFTFPNIQHYAAGQGTIGAGSTVTNQYGFVASTSLTGATNNYGFYGNIASAANRWNFYANGTADNYFAGGVGIGTNALSGKLHVAGGANSNDLFTSSTGTTYLIMGNVDGAANNKYSYVGAASNFLLFGKVNDDLTTRTEYMRITSSGNVGIGTTSIGSMLTVAGSVSFASGNFTSDTNGSLFTQGNTISSNVPNGAVGINTGPSGGTGLLVTVKAGNTSYNSLLVQGIASQTSILNVLNSAGTSLFNVLGSGNVGIGTATPSYRLDVNLSAASAGTADTARFYADASSSAEARILFGTFANPTNAAIGAQTESATAGILKFYTETAGTLTEHMRINSSGNLGIGTASPTSKLHVLDGSTGGTLTLGTSLVDGGSSTVNMYGADNYIQGNHRNVTSPVARINLFPSNLGTDSSGAISFSTRTSAAVLNEVMRINSSGNVGINTAVTNVYDSVASERPLVVAKTDATTSNIGSTASITISNSGTTTNNVSQLNFAAITGANASHYSSGIISVIHGARTNGQYPTGSMCFSTSSSTNAAPSEKMRIIATGQVGINVIPASGNTFRVINIGSDNACQFGNASNGVYLPNASPTAWSSYSDARLKDIVGDYENALEHILHLNPIKYTFKSDKNKKVNIGLLAQNVLEVIPEIVDENTLPNDAYDKTKYLSLRYTDLIPVLIGAIQEQQALITTLTERISALETK